MVRFFQNSKQKEVQKIKFCIKITSSKIACSQTKMTTKLAWLSRLLKQFLQGASTFTRILHGRMLNWGRKLRWSWKQKSILGK